MIDPYDYLRGIPFGYFITFRTYGTWLHGDERGSVDRFHNVFGSPRLSMNPARRVFEERLLAQPPVYLGRHRREATRLAIIEACDVREWVLHALNVRTTHVHVVITAEATGKNVLALLKARATTAMRRRSCWSSKCSPWSTGGSVRPLWSQKSLVLTIDYVLNRQGPDLD